MNKILVVGAGPVGLSTALWLNLNQYNVEIIDKKASLTNDTKAISINPRTLELLEGVGLSGQMIAAGNKLYRMHFRYEGRILLTVDFTKLHHRYNFMLALPQVTTEMLLNKALLAHGMTVNWKRAFVECHAEVNVARVIMEERGVRHIKYVDYCIGADGVDSSVRESQGLDFSGKAYSDSWNLVDLVMDYPYALHEVNVFLHDDGVLLCITPLGNGHYRLTANTPYALTYLPVGCQIEKILWQSNFSAYCGRAERYQKGPVFLVGDAAHTHSPASGQGMNFGIEDGYMLATWLASGQSNEYSIRRQRAGVNILADTDRLFHIASLKNPIMRYIRDHFLFGLCAKKVRQERFMRHMAGFSCQARDDLHTIKT